MASPSPPRPSPSSCVPPRRRPTAPSAAGPRHVHSRYGRSIADLPYQGRATTLHLPARKFHCKNDDCPCSVFYERLPDLVPPHGRSTTRLIGVQRVVGLALGGEPGSGLADQIGMPTSATTQLRRVKQAASKPVTKPRVLCVDDWAWNKGQSYGTILVDLKHGEVIDLLPSRDGDALKQWLLEHTGVEVISRDRASAYAHAASEAAPDAIQVADRWPGKHLPVRQATPMRRRMTPGRSSLPRPAT